MREWVAAQVRLASVIFSVIFSVISSVRVGVADDADAALGELIFVTSWN
jgi:hypothetical protein